MAGRVMTEIDGTKLSEALKKRGLGKAEVSKELGVSRSYISQAVSTNRISNASLRMLSMLYNITEDEVLPDSAGVAVKQDTEYKELYDVIFRAVTDAFTWYANGGSR